MANARSVGSDILSGAFEGAFKVLESKAKIDQENIKMKKELMKERLKKEQNFLFKIAEKELLDPIQRAQLEQYENQQAQGGPQIPGYVNGQAQMGHVNPTRGNMPFMQAAADAGQDPTSYDTMHGGSGAVRKDIFDEAIQPQAILSPSGRGFKSSTPKAKDFIYNMIQKKKSRNIPISDKEKKFEEEYMFGDSKKGSKKNKVTQSLLKSLSGAIEDGTVTDQENAFDFLEEHRVPASMQFGTEEKDIDFDLIEKKVRELLPEAPPEPPAKKHFWENPWWEKQGIGN